MAAINDTTLVGRARPSFADEGDIDEFVDNLGKYERGEWSADEWRKFRLLRGTYGQRQDDTQMMRIKIPSGIVNGPQLRALADVSARYSRGFGHVTTRQNVQFHFVALADAERAMRDLAETGLTTREACGNSVRTITSCPYAGVSHAEVFDVTPYAESMTRYFLRHRLADRLPRKFKIAFEGCTEDHALAAIHDLGWFARSVNGRRGFRLTIGGGTSILPTSGYLLYEFLPAEQMFEVAEAIVRVYHRLGDYQHRQRNRMKFLIKALGWDAWKARYDEALAEVRAEGGARSSMDPAAVAEEAAPGWEPASAPSLQSVAAKSATPVQGPGIMPGSLKFHVVPDAYARWLKSNVGVQKQAGYVHVTVRLPLGDFTAGQMRVLADLAEAYGDGSMRLTVQQNVLYRWVKQESVEAFYTRLSAAGLGLGDALRISDVVSCPGAESCKLAVTQSRGLGRAMTEHLSARPDLVDLVPSGDIKVSGCPNGCAQHHIASLGFQGSVRKVAGQAIPQYFVMVGGGCTDEGAHFGKVVAKIPVNRITMAIDRMLELYREQRQSDDENLGAFFRRVSPTTVTARLKDLAELLPNEIEPEDYIDLGESHAFKPEVMEGECAS
jgi:sulfite reductase (NADPH) hemoprotein beta-component